MILFHGSKTSFSEFDLKFLKNHSEGYGLYTTFSPGYSFTYTDSQNNVSTKTFNQNIVYEIFVEDEFILDEDSFKISNWKMLIKNFEQKIENKNLKIELKDEFKKINTKVNDWFIFNKIINFFRNKIPLNECLEIGFDFLIQQNIKGIILKQNRQMVDVFVLLFDLKNIKILDRHFV